MRVLQSFLLVTKSGKYAPDTPAEKIGKTECGIIKLHKNMLGNQITAYDKENINADKTALQPIRKSVKSNHRQHRECSQTINFGSVR